MNPKLKKFIFNKLYEDLSHVEIIPFKDSIWFIDRQTESWYLEFEKSGDLWWYHHYFTNFFSLFSMERIEFEPIIKEWVEKVLKRKTYRAFAWELFENTEAKDVLNCTVKRAEGLDWGQHGEVALVLDYKVNGTSPAMYPFHDINGILNYKMIRPRANHLSYPVVVGEILNVD